MSWVWARVGAWPNQLKNNQATLIRFGLIFVVALGLRLTILATIEPNRLYTRWCPNCSDAGDYSTLAINLVKYHQYQKNGQPVAERPPLYPAFVALIYQVAGLKNYVAVRLLQIGLSALTVVILSHIAQRLFGPTAAWIAGGLLAIYPFLLIFSVELYSETFFAFLLACAMWLLVPYPNRPQPSITQGIVGGVLIGVGALTRELAILLLPTLTIGVWIFQRRLWTRWLIALWLGAGAIVGIWTVRNYLTWGQFIPISTHTYSNIVHSLVDDYGHYLEGAAAVIPSDVPPDTVNPFAWLGRNSQVEQESYARELVWSYCRQQPGICVETWVRNLIKLVNPIISGRSLAIVIPTALIHSAVWIFGIAGLVQLLRQKRSEVSVFFISWFALCLGVCALVHVEVRYRMPIIDPYLIIMAAYPLSSLWQHWRTPTDPIQTPAT